MYTEVDESLILTDGKLLDRIIYLFFHKVCHISSETKAYTLCG